MFRHGLRAAAFIGLAACGKEEPPSPECRSDLSLHDENNYHFSVALDLSTAPAAAGTNVSVDWSGFTQDFRGRPVDPADLDRVTVASFQLDHATLLERIGSNSVLMADVGVYYQVDTVGATTAQFDQFAILGNAFPFETEFVEGFAPTWLMTLWKKNELGVLEIASSQFLDPVPGGPATLAWGNEVANLTFEPDLTQPVVCAAANSPPYSLDWSGVQTDVNGAPFDDLTATSLRISHLPSADLAEVAGQLLQLDLIADQTYYADVYATRRLEDLSTAVTLDGQAFPGFSSSGTWLVDFSCTLLECFSPAPVLLVVVQAD